MDTTHTLLDIIARRVEIILKKEAIVRAKLGSESGLVRSIRHETTGEELIFYAAQYIQWVESGRPSVAKKPNIKKVPIEALERWVEAYQIRPRAGQTMNGLLYAIQNGIYKHGIRPRPFTAAALEEIDKFVNPFLDANVGGLLDTVFQGFADTQTPYVPKEK